jgi:ribA/ribD-fused uncharacterized protein
MPGTNDWWNSAENAFQAAKATTPDEYRAIRDATPYQAKQLGRKVALHPGWDAHKREVMLRVLLAKFESGALRERLTGTWPTMLVESNHWGDTYWGAVSPDHPKFNLHRLPVWESEDGQMWTGHNWLGQLLIVVREVCV